MVPLLVGYDFDQHCCTRKEELEKKNMIDIGERASTGEAWELGKGMENDCEGIPWSLLSFPPAPRPSWADRGKVLETWLATYIGAIDVPRDVGNDCRQPFMGVLRARRRGC